MDEKTTHAPDRWCPECGHWVPDEQQRVRADGLRRHSACDTVTTPTKTTLGEHLALATNGDGKQARKCTCDVGEDHFAGTPRPTAEMRELAGRMADDEAAKGDYAAAEELKSFAEGGPVELRGEAGPELLFPQRPTRVHHDANCVELLLGGRCNCSAAETGPLTPGQVMCRICRLDDRTRAATDPNDQQCDVCRADLPNRLARERRSTLETAVEKWSGWTDHGGNGAESRTEAMMRFADLVDDHPRASELIETLRAVAAAKPKGELDPALNAEQRQIVGIALEDIEAGGTGTVRLVTDLGSPIRVVHVPPSNLRVVDTDSDAERVSTVDWSVLAPELVAAAQARQHVWDAGAGSLRDCYCHRGVDHTEQPLTDLQIAAMEMSAAMNQLDAVGWVSPDQERNRVLAEQLVDDLADCPTLQERLTPTAAAEVAMWIVARGWVPGAREQDHQAGGTQ